MTDQADYIYVWRVRTVHPERKGTRCRIVEILAANAYHVEFEDGAIVFAVHNYFTLAK